MVWSVRDVHISLFVILFVSPLGIPVSSTWIRGSSISKYNTSSYYVLHLRAVVLWSCHKFTTTTSSSSERDAIVSFHSELDITNKSVSSESRTIHLLSTPREAVSLVVTVTSAYSIAVAAREAGARGSTSRSSSAITVLSIAEESISAEAPSLRHK